MDCFKLLSIAGICLELAGVLLIAWSDSLAKAIGAAYDKIPGNPLLAQYEAAKTGELRFASEEERDCLALARRSDGRKELRTFRFSLFLIIVGMVAQLMAAAAGV